MAARMCWNRPREIMTSASWKVIVRPWRTILAPIFTSRSRSVVSDHCFISDHCTRASPEISRLLRCFWRHEGDSTTILCQQLQPVGEIWTATGAIKASDRPLSSKASLKPRTQCRTSTLIGSNQTSPAYSSGRR